MSGNKIELELCPFCGGKALMKRDQIGKFFAECLHCGARSAAYSDESEAAEAWGKHVDPAAITAYDFTELRALTEEALSLSVKAASTMNTASDMMLACIKALCKLQGID